MKHIIATRCSFEDSILFDKYLSVMRSVYIPSLSTQTNKNFSVYIMIHPQHKDVIENAFKDSGVHIITCVCGSLLEFSKLLMNTGAEIQTRHDCDDWMADSYIDDIQKCYLEESKLCDTFLIQAQPTKYEISSGHEYSMTKYGPFKTSMFLSLCQKLKVRGIMDFKHNEYWKHVPVVKDLPSGLVKWTVHGNNLTAKINPNDKKI